MTQWQGEKGQTTTVNMSYLDELRHHCRRGSVNNQELDVHAPVLDEAGFHVRGRVSVIVGGHFDSKTLRRASVFAWASSTLVSTLVSTLYLRSRVRVKLTTNTPRNGYIVERETLFLKVCKFLHGGEMQMRWGLSGRKPWTTNAKSSDTTSGRESTDYSHNTLSEWEGDLKALKGLQWTVIITWLL